MHWSVVLWTVVTVGVAYGLGHLINVVFGGRLVRLAARTHGSWDDALVKEIGRRIPFWSLLVGIYLAVEHWPLSDHEIEFATRIVSAVGVASVTFALAAIAGRLAAIYGPRASPSVPVSGLTQNLARMVVFVLGLLVIVQSFGYSIAPYLTALGVSGLALALALQDPLSNLFAGVFIAVARQIRIGDYIRLDTGMEGVVVDFNWRSTRLRQLSDNIIVVPNLKLSQAIVTNYNLPSPETSIGVEFAVDRTADLDQVERVSLQVAGSVVQRMTGAVGTAPASVTYSAFTDSGVKLSVGVRVRTFVDQFKVKHELIKELHAAFAREGIGPPISRTTSVPHTTGPGSAPSSSTAAPAANPAADSGTK